MNLYHISQSVNNGWDTYDSAVVAAETAEQAAATHPYEFAAWDSIFPMWASFPEQVTVKLIGTALEGTTAGVILSSFNAG